MPLVSLDTNILVYAVDPAEEDKCRIARDVVRAAALGNALLTQQVVGEFLNVGRRMAHLNQRRIRDIAAALLDTFPIEPTAPEQLFAAFDRSTRYRLQYWDSVIMTVCLSRSVAFLISEDMQDGLVVDGLTVINPFDAANADLLSTIFSPPP